MTNPPKYFVAKWQDETWWKCRGSAGRFPDDARYKEIIWQGENYYEGVEVAKAANLAALEKRISAGQEKLAQWVEACKGDKP